MSFSSRYFSFFVFIFSTILLYAQEQTVENRDSLATDSLLSFCDTDSINNATYEELPWPENIQKKLSNLLKHNMFQTSQVAVMVYDLTADSTIFCHNERQIMRPASTQKIVTAITALDLLGGNYELTTRLCYTGDIEGRTLYGNIYCVGAMDPLFNSDDMRAFAKSVTAAGIDTIRGKIIADQTMKDSDRLGEGWCWDDKNPSLAPLLFNGKDNFMPAFLTALEREGIFIDASVEEGAVQKNATEICKSYHTINQVLDKMMKKSDNLFAETIFYQIAAHQGGRHAAAKHAATVIKRLINKIGLNASEYKIADGSGLSLYNYISAEAEVKLLKYAWNERNIYYDLYESLPIAAVDGTLQNRMAGTKAAGIVRAKTGTVTGVSSLAGYCFAANGHELCFAIISNGLLSTSRGRSFQDRVCIALCE